MIWKTIVAVLILANLVGAMVLAGRGDKLGALLLLMVATFLRVGQNTPPPRR
jgi:hypothetical protein